MHPAIRAVLEDIGRGDWQQLAPRLHPYLHWRTEDGRALRGRRNVLAEVATRPPGSEPSSFELRDGQIYRWTS